MLYIYSLKKQQIRKMKTRRELGDRPRNEICRFSCHDVRVSTSGELDVLLTTVLVHTY